jgi:hypothetical protein
MSTQDDIPDIVHTPPNHPTPIFVTDTNDANDTAVLPLTLHDLSTPQASRGIPAFLQSEPGDRLTLDSMLFVPAPLSRSASVASFASNISDIPDEVVPESELRQIEVDEYTIADAPRPNTASRMSVELAHRANRRARSQTGLSIDTSPIILKEATPEEAAVLSSARSHKSRRPSVARMSTFYSFSQASVHDDEEGQRGEELYEVEYNKPTAESMLTVTRKYATNYIRTTKYTVWSFLPVNLFNQFRRFYNLYFLLSAVFALLEPSLNPITEAFPLIVVLGITAIKDALEDYVPYLS